ncbi:TetR/AcrR family transcriptional regulator [Candidatus Fermentibacteria bacterium]|nr:TetR/AcrR family transcriptional regulator [Candidatus Fermentibacteria bacterium]
MGRTMRDSNIRQKILAAAMEALAEKNYAGVSMNSIAESCGITKPTIYYYFKSKRGLFTALARMVWEDLKDIVRNEISSGRTLRESLCRIAERFLETPLTEPRRAKVHLAFAWDPNLRTLLPSLRDEMTEMHSLLTRLFELGVERGEISPATDMDLSCRIFASVIHAYLARGIYGFDSREHKPSPGEIVDVLLQGLAGCGAKEER